MTLEIIATVFVPIILSNLFYLMKNMHREFLGGNGNFLPLIDALDGCHNESVNTKVLQLFVNLLTGDPSYINLKHTLQENFLLIRVYLGFFTQSSKAMSMYYCIYPKMVYESLVLTLSISVSPCFPLSIFLSPSRG